MIKTPIKPMTTAVHRRTPTRSPKISACDLQSRLGGFRSGIDKKNMIQAVGSQSGEARGKFDVQATVTGGGVAAQAEAALSA